MRSVPIVYLDNTDVVFSESFEKQVERLTLSLQGFMSAYEKPTLT